MAEDDPTKAFEMVISRYRSAFDLAFYCVIIILSAIKIEAPQLGRFRCRYMVGLVALDPVSTNVWTLLMHSLHLYLTFIILTADGYDRASIICMLFMIRRGVGQSLFL